jgi:hypothetical protein
MMLILRRLIACTPGPRQRQSRRRAHFGRMWDAAAPIIEFGPAINALEPKQP